MMNNQSEQVDFSNVTFSDFGKLSSAQKVGFLITLLIALPVVAVVKFFQLFPAHDVKNKNEQEVASNSDISNVFDSRQLGDTDWHADEMAYGEIIADMNVDATNNGTAL
jgi:hypothetical protein